MFGRKKGPTGFIKNTGIDPDEVLLDAFNLPAFDTNQFEGRVERSIHGMVPHFVGVATVLILLLFAFQVWNLQIAKGEAFSVLSQKNRLDHEVLFAERGNVYDRNNNELAWNVPPLPEEGEDIFDSYSLRSYTSAEGFGHILGFVGYPEKDASGYWWRTEYVGKDGIESSLDSILQGTNGVRIIEVDALNNIQSENTIEDPIDGESVMLNIDAQVQSALFKAVKEGARTAGFVGGAGLIMDVTSGAIIAMTSYPEYSPQIMTDGSDTQKIGSYSVDEQQPFLNRAVLGEYTPGSIVKPYIAAAALAEGLVTPSTSILSTGEIRIPNPYSPGNDSIFRDWKVHGWVNVTQALAVSSNVYFYAVGGGYEDQEGLGIEKLAAYASRFGLGKKTGIELGAEGRGVVPTPAWKKEVFGEENPWRLGNTYHTAIGQFGFLITPIQALRYISAVANGGTLVTPRLMKESRVRGTSVGISDEYLSVVRAGMKKGVTEGIAASLNVSGIEIAAKTGTAQLGERNESMNSWVIGFWPADKPRFAFVTVLEKAPAGTLQGAAPAMRSFFEWLSSEQPEYARGEYKEI